MHTLDVSHARRAGWEYRSRAEVNGLPVVHLSFAGVDRVRRPRVAKGVFAFGDVAIGLVAVGGIAIAPLAFGGIAIGLVAVGGVAAGALALAGVAIGVVAAGAVAVGLTAFGEVAVSAAVVPVAARVQSQATGSGGTWQTAVAVDGERASTPAGPSSSGRHG